MNAAKSSKILSPEICETSKKALLPRYRIRDFVAKKYPPLGGISGGLMGEPGWGMLFLGDLLQIGARWQA